MKRVLAPVLIALLLAAAGGYAWMRADGERRLAEGRQALATLQFGAAMPTAGDQASANYWRTKYDALALEHDASGVLVERDPEVLFIAANAAYRSLDRDGADRRAVAQRLDAIIKSYSEVIKKEGAPEDAAYNYELLIRQRDAIIKPRSVVASNPQDAAGQASIHGHQGAPPREADMSTFKTIVPRQREERNEELKSGPGSVPNRKG